jgi:hypothetical protein
MGVATGFTIQSTNFTVPCGVPNGSYKLCVIANGISSDCVPVTVGPVMIKVPINDAMVAYLIGSLADGPLWALTPHGPVPVDPWGPDIAKQARAAFLEIIGGVKTLRELGQQVMKLQAGAIENHEVKPAVASGSRQREAKK